jgi:hypothetical protein
MLAELGDKLKAMGIMLALARVRTPVCKMLERTSFSQTIEEDHICSSVEAGAEALAR